MSFLDQRTREWLETDGLGGFASGTVAGIRTRRYHALLLAATDSGRVVLVNGLEAWVETAVGPSAISTQRYAPDVIHPDGVNRLEAFESEPWPRWTYRLDDGSRIVHECFVVHGSPLVALRWSREGDGRATLHVRPLLSGRDYHSLHRENPAFRFDAERTGGHVRWRPYADLPAVAVESNGAYEHSPVWYRQFRYECETERGLDDREDLASPGVFRWDLCAGDAYLLISADAAADTDLVRLCESERRRRAGFPSPLHRSADAYLVRTDGRQTVIAGYPWFTDWGRDTFIALRGLCLSTGRIDQARAILVDWAGTVSEGMLPNRFPDRRSEPEFNSVDASLWYCVAVHDLLQSATAHDIDLPCDDEVRLLEAVDAILTGYSQGTRFGIRADRDGLLDAGEPGTQLTWMDACVNGRAVTPRVGKPVEVQALWLNALRFGGRFSPRWRQLFEHALAVFRERFWDAEAGMLFDVVDVDHRTGEVDRRFRPNQILAVGGLPFRLLESEPAHRVVDAIEARLVTPLGLRTLAPGEPGYIPHHGGGVAERDGAYHQGPAWPWLLGPFVEAWVGVRRGTRAAKDEARARFLEPLLAQRQTAGLGHLPELADAELPFTPRGCPFQAWSLGEALRLHLTVLAPCPDEG